VLVVDGGRVVDFPRSEVPVWVRRSVRNAPVAEGDLAIESTGARVRVIEVIPRQLLTNARAALPKVENGCAVADPERDIAKIVVIERHHATGRIGKGFVTGFGLQRGAFASTVAHDAHNLVIVGTSDRDMAACVSHLGTVGGGIVAVEDGEVVGDLPLPVAGLLSDEPVGRVVEKLEALHEALAGMGVRISAPFTTLGFLALSVIPALKITDQGLIDVDRFEIVPLEIEDS
jgi:adenine deaminase